MKKSFRTGKRITAILLASLMLLPWNPRQISAADQPNLPKAVTKMGFRYAENLPAKKNAVYSPYGLSQALGLVTCGIPENTAAGANMLTLLGAKDLADLQQQNKAYSEGARFGTDNTFRSVNMLLVDKSVGGKEAVLPDYLTAVTDAYHATVRTADFKHNLAAEKELIKQNVSTATGGFLSDYESIADESTDTDLMNITYFKGKWQYPFKTELTKNKKFKNVSGKTKKVPMMHQVYEEKIRYYADKNFRGIILPYSAKASEDGTIPSRVEMVIILPKKKTDLKCVKKWNQKSDSYRQRFLKKLTKAGTDNITVLDLPRFELDETVDLKDIFPALGAGDLLGSPSPVTNILKDPLLIDAASQRTKIKVDEEGTEAAAVTEITAKVTSIGPSKKLPRYTFKCNVPFVFMIRDEKGMTLFAGAVNKL
ncbi:MAG: hypothetical protein K5739_11360 [Lachnospiraceae bacterium]|nr:hypothetical protein [Lachnospiraceae bacterium]